MMIGIGTPSSQSNIPRPIATSYIPETKYQFPALAFVPEVLFIEIQNDVDRFICCHMPMLRLRALPWQERGLIEYPRPRPLKSVPLEGQTSKRCISSTLRTMASS
ncbi:MAG: hypothetical protein E5V65_01770 [Mesorhizobium sp.]|nr:MAG: hypothetical protein E5V65_01770 [Mesorhizobium sp.]